MGRLTTKRRPSERVQKFRRLPLMAERWRVTRRSHSKKVNEAPVKTKANGKNVVNAGFLGIALLNYVDLIKALHRSRLVRYGLLVGLHLSSYRA